MKVIAVGINDYNASSIPNLNGCINDANLVSTLFTVLGHQVEIIPNVTRTQALKLAKDTDILYWSGHGTRLRVKSGYKEALVCAYDNGQLIDNVITDEELLNMNLKCVILDTCFSGGMREKFNSDDHPNLTPKFFMINDLGSARKLRPKMKNEESCILSSSRSKEVSYEIDCFSDKHGLFTLALCEVIYEGRFSLSAVYERMSNISKSRALKQHPEANNAEAFIKIIGGK